MARNEGADVTVFGPDAEPVYYDKVFLGACAGVGLSQRSNEDKHVVFTILVEDDEHWFSSSGEFSSFWLSDLQRVLQEAKDWMEANCGKEEDGFGWRFR